MFHLRLKINRTTLFMLVLTLLLLPAIIASTTLASPSASPATRGKGWVWASDPSIPSYAPPPAYQYNSSGAANRINHDDGPGRYRVDFPGLATLGGTVQVSAYQGNHSCKVARWGPNGTAQSVYVNCFDSSGTPVDGKFTLLYYVEDRGAAWRDAYLWANQPTTPSYTPDRTYQWNSQGQINTVRRIDTGNYLARLPGMDRIGGTVLVTAYGDNSERCKVGEWNTRGSDTFVSVRCFNASGDPVDARYTLSYMIDVGLGISVSAEENYGGYLWANNSTAASYTPSRTYQLNNSGHTNTAEHLSTGHYRVGFPGLKSADRTTAVVTAYGTGEEYCTVKGWGSDGSQGTNANVQCFNQRGVHVDTRFTLTYLTDEPMHGTNESLRIGTYNFQFFPGIVETFAGHCCDEIPNRPQKLAERIKASDYDIIVLQEVFDDDAKDALVAELRLDYPHFVKELRLLPDSFERATTLEDSGLMLFSRWPFQPLPENAFIEGIFFRTETYPIIPPAIIPPFEPSLPALPSIIEASDATRVAYIPFEQCADDDCHADKGAGYVRIENPHTLRIYNVVFTHLQAEGDVIKEHQLDQIEDLIRGTMNGDQIEREDIFVLGDLNINGTRDEIHRTLYDRTLGPISTHPFFFEDLHDAWNLQPPRDDTQHPSVPKEKRDRGITDIFGTGRLDHILHNNEDTSSRPSGARLCIQHMTQAYNLRHGEPIKEGGMYEGGLQDLSDHYGLNADVNSWAPRCSPHDADRIRASDFDRLNNMVKEGTITSPGNVQWYLVGEEDWRPDTYSIDVVGQAPLTDEDLNFRIYKSSQMSVPYQGEGYMGETTPFTYEETIRDAGAVRETEVTRSYMVSGRKYGFLEPPFYVKVYASNDEGLPSRAKTGNYRLIIHRNTGETKDEAKILAPNLWQDMDIGPVVRPVRWFQIDTERPDSDRPQELRFRLEPMDDNPYQIELWDASGAVIANAAGLGPLVIERHTAADSDQRMYLRVTMDPSARRFRFRVGWSTNLVVLHSTVDTPMKIKNVAQTDLLGDDGPITMKVSVGRHVIPHSLELGDFDTGQVKTISGSALDPIRFLLDESLRVQLIESDRGLTLGDDILENRVFSDPRIYATADFFATEMKTSLASYVWAESGTSGPWPTTGPLNLREAPSEITDVPLGEELPSPHVWLPLGVGEYDFSFVLSHGLQGQN